MLLTQRQIAQQIVAAGGDDVMLVKDNQPQLLEDMQTVFAFAPIAGEQRLVAETAVWQYATGDGRMAAHRHWADAVGRPDAHGRRVSPFCGPARVSLEA